MFSDLQNKVSKNRDRKKASDSHSVKSSMTAGSMVGSTESLTSLNSATTNRKSDRIKYLEGKVAELGVLLRQKSAFIDSSTKEIDRLKAQLRQTNSIPEKVNFGPHTNRSSEKSMDRSDLNSMLNKAEANLAAVNRLSEEVIAQKEELNRKANMELESVRLTLSKTEEEVRSLQAKLAEKLTENELLSRQLAHCSKEIEVKNIALEDAKDIRSKMISDLSAKDESLKQLIFEKATANQECELEKALSALAAQERESSETSDTVQRAQAEGERTASGAQGAEVRVAEREADLKDRIRFLEERLMLLTEPDSALFSEPIEEARLSTSSSIPGEESLKAATAKCTTLLVERKLLETRLSETRKHLEDVKSNLNEKLMDCESQISHLNERISENASEFAAERAQWDNLRQNLESQLSEAREKYMEAESTVSSAISQRTEMERAIEEERREWQLIRASLEAKISALQENAELGSRTQAEAIRNSHELRSQISILEKEVERGAKEVDQLKCEKEELNKELMSRISMLELEASVRTKKIDELNREKDELQQELQSRILSMEEEAKNGSKQVTTLIQEKEKLKEELQSMVSSLKSELDSHTMEVETLKKEKDELQQLLQSRIADSERNVKVRLQQSDQLRHENERLKQELQSRTLVLEQETERNSKQVATLNKEREELREALQAKILSLESELENCAKEVDTLKQENADLQQELHSQIADFEKKAEVSLQQIDAFRRENEELKMVQQELQSKLSVLEKNAEVISKSAEAPGSEKEQLQQELCQRISTLENDVQNSIKEADRLRQENEELCVHLEAKTTEVTLLQETKCKHESSTQQSSEEIFQTELESINLNSKNAEIRAEIGCLKQVNEAESTQFAESRDNLAKEVAELQTSLDESPESMHAAQSPQLECQKLREERDFLYKKITELEKNFTDGINKNDINQKIEISTEVATLKASIDELNEVIFNQNKTIRLQKQKLSELKKALGQGLRQVAASNLSLTDEDVQTHSQRQHHDSYSVSGSVVGFTAGGNGTSSEVTLPPLFAISQQAANATPRPPLPFSSASSRPHPPLAFPPEVLPILAESTPTSAATSRNLTALSPTVSTSPVTVVNSQYETDAINFEYTRHVLLKFLLSHDTEALQLVRAVATVLRLSKKDEFLIRQKLEDRRSWFATPVVATKSSGQFAKMVPPP